MRKLSSLTIFFPCLNDGKTMPTLVEQAQEAAKKITDDFEVIVVDDGSTDETTQVLDRLKDACPFVRIIRHEKNLGYGAALQSGFRNAQKDWVFYTDGDGQYDPRELILLVEQVDDAIDAVNGYKLQRADNFVRAFIGNVYNFLLHRFYKLPIRDIDCDFRLIRRKFLKITHFTSTTGLICLELIVKLQASGARFTEVAVHHYRRVSGSSQFFNLGNIFKTFLDHFYFYYKLHMKQN